MLTDILQHQPLKLHIPPPPASSKTHSKEETQRIKQEKMSTSYTF